MTEKQNDEEAPDVGKANDVPRKSGAVGSASLLSVTYELEQFRNGISTIWKRNLLVECEKEFDARRREIKRFNRHEWRIVRVERHLVEMPNV